MSCFVLCFGNTFTGVFGILKYLVLVLEMWSSLMLMLELIYHDYAKRVGNINYLLVHGLIVEL